MTESRLTEEDAELIWKLASSGHASDQHRLRKHLNQLTRSAVATNT